jgi:hypothetical protein
MKAFITATALLASAGSAFGALQQVTGFGTNPSNIQMFISVPAKLATNPAIVVAVRSFVAYSQTQLYLIVFSSFTHVVVQRHNGIAAPSCQPRPKAWASF